MNKFTYIIGGNIELHVEAKLEPAEEENYFLGGAEIVSVKLADGSEVEIDDIYIRPTTRSAMVFEPDSLNDILEEEAMSQGEDNA